MVKVLLTKLFSSHENLRTRSVMGFSHDLPVVGEPFVLFSNPLDPAASIRVVRTTPVEKTLDPPNGSSEFWTANSHYRIDILGHPAEV